MQVVIYGLHPIKAWQFQRISGPKAKWLVGNFDAFLTGRGMHLVFMDWARKHGPMFKVSLSQFPHRADY